MSYILIGQAMVSIGVIGALLNLGIITTIIIAIVFSIILY